jgi:hypothetical protein
MYLGRHFPADILGSLMIAMGFIVIFFYLLRKDGPLSGRLFTGTFQLKAALPDLAMGVYLFVLPFFLLLVPGIEKEETGVFFGMNVGLVCLWIKGLPGNGGKWRHRLARIATAGIVYYGTKGLLDALFKLYGVDDSIPAEWINRFLSYFLLIWGSTKISIRLGFYKRYTPNAK